MSKRAKLSRVGIQGTNVFLAGKEPVGGPSGREGALPPARAGMRDRIRSGGCCQGEAKALRAQQDL